jgi:hypothetical protein
MQVQRIDSLFNFDYVKTTAEIVHRAKEKAAQIRAKIEEREARIRRVREEYKITDTVLLDIMNRARAASKRGENMISYSNTVQPPDGGSQEEITIGAGIIELLFTEEDHIAGEKANVEKLDMIIRNLKDKRRFAPDGKEYTEGHQLTTPELRFLGF